MLSEIRPALVSTILLTLLLGLAYPLAVTGVAKVAFPYQAQGSLVRDKAGHHSDEGSDQYGRQQLVEFKTVHGSNPG